MTTEINQEQKEFLKLQLWKSTMRASISRAGEIYTPGTTAKKKSRFRVELLSFVTEMIRDHYETKTSDDQTHLENISKLKDFASGFGFVMLRFGHAQKILNLFLKYLWCLGYVQEPPHFPVDRLIQKRLRIQNFSNWTNEMEKEGYMKVIEEAKIVAKRENFRSIAALELSFYNDLW
ncbi:hypothetical protein [Algoriphagus boritolerans]|uniref:Uncharacterized protein n=1 Tax=Algoriphagus boritolerans DSM 17298 = JCM 18970 TaxID=1120964 RepID=A0A1H6A4G8_9BACT|nr:hypothetical protein [Algoriphagus boritolerans]SEG43240.1 hypothetical protein SAMN03080598_03905 [Algoriphagus boritolerans DSM 17298 = JCM 18970]